LVSQKWPGRIALPGLGFRSLDHSGRCPEGKRTKPPYKNPVQVHSARLADGEKLELVLAAIAHAGGDHEHSYSGERRRKQDA
jgi:hypothetical protein